ncbi:ATP-binding cassette domain-containing protein [Paenibacillus sp. FSL R7-0331]|uniref:ATP-binding cassette domain-containing protein n=1 Tax=Paenibacillus sp. FSL R7-0331 TaxID=1536773 RepID=UPI000694BFA9|nr:ABC transporter ATP-binding protein [Paenibacillus sp. FSL R7-0331]
MASSNTLITLTGASKIYGRRAVLNEVSLSIEAGTATALIGRNGSGKSTLLAVMAGLLKLSSGVLQQSKPKLRIGYAPEAFTGTKLPAEQYLRYMGQISGIPDAQLERQITGLLEAFQLQPFRKEPVISFSKGMLQKVNLIQSLLGEPQLLLLDEPLSGLDLPAQHTLIDCLQELKRKGTALVLSVHEPLCVEALEAGVHVLQAGRTLMVTSADKLRGTLTSCLLCTELAQHEQQLITGMPGYIAVRSVQTAMIGRCTEWTVETAFADTFLLHILQRGGSVISVEHGRSRNLLEEWMDPKQSVEENAG